LGNIWIDFLVYTNLFFHTKLEIVIMIVFQNDLLFSNVCSQDAKAFPSHKPFVLQRKIILVLLAFSLLEKFKFEFSFSASLYFTKTYYLI